MKGLIILRLIEASDLIVADLGGSSDPYAIISLGTSQDDTKARQRGISRTIAKTVNPKYDETFNFVITPAQDTFFFEFWDRDLISDDFLGKGTLLLPELPHYKAGTFVIPLLSSQNKPQGEVHVRITFIDFNAPPIPLYAEMRTLVADASHDDFGFKLAKLNNVEPPTPSLHTEGRIVSGGVNLVSDGKIQNHPNEVLALKGIPVVHRGELWMVNCGAKRRKNKNALGTYVRLLSDNSGKVTAATEQIEKDITRTFPGHPFFQSSQGMDALQRVLLAYSWYHPVIGYCQGMNFLAGFLLLFMEEEDAFWTLSQLVETIVTGYFEPDMRGIQVDQRVFEELFIRYHPDLHDHFSKNGVILSVSCVQWLLCLYIDMLPTLTTQRLWDSLMCGHKDITIQVGLGLLSMFKKDFLKMDNPSEMYMALNELPKKIVGQGRSEQLWKTVIHDYWGILGLQSMREKHMVAIKQSMKKRELLRLQKFTKFSMSDLEKLEKKFEAALSSKGTDEYGGLTAELFQQIVSQEMDSNDAAFADYIFQIFDESGDGYVDFKEFCMGLSVYLNADVDDKLHFCFRLFDTNRDGKISLSEFTEVLRTHYSSILFEDLVIPSPEDFALEAFNFDADHNGYLTYDEFKKFALAHPILLKYFNLERQPSMRRIVGAVNPSLVQ
eukprot:TRINITY_DN5101_c0_g1_i4.p1 TRINITY_DN5101_c0_g1~~TRINITY_DN5101_c0_g1_i4.p1  ORF type:complete len:665 (+),score=142.60 TRINITY_DN5101_c0_g1_i4:257-2251(+)